MAYFFIHLALFAFPTALAAIIIVLSTKNNRTLHRVMKRLKTRLGFRDAENVSDSERAVTGKVETMTVLLRPAWLEPKSYVHVTLSGDVFLPTPLQLTKYPEDLVKEIRPKNVLRVDREDFAALNETFGRPVVDAETTALLSCLERRASNYYISNGTIDLLLPLSAATPARTEELITAAARLASRFREIGRRTDLALEILRLRARSHSSASERRTAFFLLLKRYRRHPAARETFADIMAHPEVELGLLSALALGHNQLAYLRDCLFRLPVPQKIEAIRCFSGRNIPGTIPFLTDFFRETREPRLRREIVMVLGKALTRQALDVVLAALQDDSPEVQLAAVEAVAGKGGREALAPLYRVATAGATPALRARAEAASDAISKRLGLKPEGQLSLAGGEEAAGGLSKAEESKKAEDGDQTDTESNR
jgi:hypothetical protein